MKSLPTLRGHDIKYERKSITCQKQGHKLLSHTSFMELYIRKFFHVLYPSIFNILPQLF